MGQRGLTLDFFRPGKPTDNAFIESFNGKLRAECLNAHWFMSLDDARKKCEAWRRPTTRRGLTARSPTKPRSSLPIDQRRTARPERSRLENSSRPIQGSGAVQQTPDLNLRWM